MPSQSPELAGSPLSPSNDKGGGTVNPHMMEAAGHEIWTEVSISMLTADHDQRRARGAEKLNVKITCGRP